MTYAEDDYLQLSGIQHFAFCRRQWALMQIEQQWADNWRTIDGTAMHDREHNEKLGEKRNGVFTAGTGSGCRTLCLSAMSIGRKAASWKRSW